MVHNADGVGALLVGRADERARLRGLTDPPSSAAEVLIVLGAPGMGKTALLADAAGRASAAGTRVLRVTGRESESLLAFAGLYQLLRPVMTAVARLPGRQRRSLERALGLVPDAEPPADAEPPTGVGPPPDPILPGVALLEVLADLAKRSPVLVVVDDAQWVDSSSLEALAFAARRLEAEPVVVLVAARDTQVPTGFERRHAELRLPPLSNREANQLLDALSEPPRGRARGHVLAQAEGNPLALIELARAVAADPGAARYGTAEPIPLADRLTASMAGRLAELPHLAREALLVAAAADNPDLPGVPVEALAPAISLGLVTEDGAGARFAHPLVRTAVYHAAPFARRAAAHRRVAEALTDHPDRQAWHLAAATLDTDEHVAQMLEDTAVDAQRRGGPAAAVAALERAADLSPEPRERGRRLAAAALAAMQTGQVGWIQELVDRAGAAVSDPELLRGAREAVLWGLAWSGTHEAAMVALLPYATEGDDWGDVRWTMLASAATVAYTSGVPREVAAVKNALAAQADRGQIPADAMRRAEVDANWLWVRAATGPFRDTADLMTTLDALSRMPDQREHPLSWAAPSAWLTDQTELSIELHERLMRRLDALKIGPRGGPLLSLGWSYVDAGRWDQALAVAAEGADLGVAYKMPVVTLTCDLITGIVHAMRGNATEARRHAGYALAGDPERNRAIEARARHALGLAAVGEGDYAAAFSQLRELFAADGQPLHFHLSYLALADLAAAGARAGAGAGAECQRLLGTWLGHLDGTPTPRVAQLIARARALLADSGSAEPYFHAGLADPAGSEWPFERALLRLDFGEWLRRRRRINEAKEELATAQSVFRRLRAQPWLDRAETELRACGVDVTPPAGALGELSPQQRQIVYLANLGLTNREIADRLFLSHRTVSSHLHQAYPKLGIVGRHQLGSVINAT